MKIIRIYNIIWLVLLCLYGVNSVLYPLNDINTQSKLILTLGAIIVGTSICLEKSKNAVRNIIFVVALNYILCFINFKIAQAIKMNILDSFYGFYIMLALCFLPIVVILRFKEENVSIIPSGPFLVTSMFYVIILIGAL